MILLDILDILDIDMLQIFWSLLPIASVALVSDWVQCLVRLGPNTVCTAVRCGRGGGAVPYARVEGRRYRESGGCLVTEDRALGWEETGLCRVWGRQDRCLGLGDGPTLGTVVLHCRGCSTAVLLL